MLNEWVGMGRLTATPELKSTPSGTSVATFTLAIDRDFTSGENKQADFINMVAWGKTAEFVAKYFSKGKLMAAKGSVRTRSYTAQDGSKRYVTEINAEKVYFAGDREKTSQNGNTSVSEGDADVFGGMGVMDDEELPF